MSSIFEVVLFVFSYLMAVLFYVGFMIDWIAVLKQSSGILSGEGIISWYDLVVWNQNLVFSSSSFSLDSGGLHNKMRSKGICMCLCFCFVFEGDVRRVYSWWDI